MLPRPKSKSGSGGGGGGGPLQPDIERITTSVLKTTKTDCWADHSTRRAATADSSMTMVNELHRSTGLPVQNLETLLSTCRTVATATAVVADEEAQLDGRLTRKQFEDVWRNAVPGAEALAPVVFDAIDTDCDGYVNFQDIAYGVKMVADDSVLDKLTWALRLCEATGITTVKYSRLTAIARDVIRLSKGAVLPAVAELEEHARNIVEFVGRFLGIDDWGGGTIKVPTLMGALEAAKKYYARSGPEPGHPLL